MSEVGNDDLLGRQTQAENDSSHRSLEYGRDLAVQLFHDESPLVNLGYSTKQKEALKRAIRTMEEPGNFYLQPKPYVEFGRRKPEGSSDDAPKALLTELTRGGYRVKASMAPAFSDTGYITNGIVDLSSEADIEIVLGVFEMLPAGIDVTDVDGLVKHLYEGALINRYGKRGGPEILSPSLLSTIRSKLSSSVASFRAGWIDDAKLELVVETDAHSRLIGHKFGPKNTDTWRRLPEIELEGQSWIPFGKKPNPSQDVISRALRGSIETKMSLPKLAPNALKS